MDELPVWGFVGLPPEEAKDDEHIYLYTHKSLEINYNEDRVSSTPISSMAQRERGVLCRQGV